METPALECPRPVQLRITLWTAACLALLWAGCSTASSTLTEAPDADPGAGGLVEAGGPDAAGGAGGAVDAAPPAADGSAAGATGGRVEPGATAPGGAVSKTGGVATGGKVGTGGATAQGGASRPGGTKAGTSSAKGGTTPGSATRTGGTGGTIQTDGTGGTTRTGGVPATGGTTGIVVSAPLAGAPGNPEGHASIPADAQLEDVSNPTTVVGNGTLDSCSGEAFIAAVAKGGVITFDCGPGPATVRLSQPAKVFNDKGPKIVIDGGGKVTLSGEGVTRILYMNTCDEKQVWTTSHCDNQESPQLTVQNLTFANGNSKNETEYDGGGAIYASGGRFKAINSRFVNNVCADTGPDVGGGAIRVFQQYNGLPAYVVNCTFGGADGLGNVCSNGGALSSIGVSWTVLNSVISYNQAVGNGGNPEEANTPGGGSGGGIYNDGKKMTLTIAGTLIQYNKVNAFGSAIFFVSNDKTGDIVIDSSTITGNIGGSWYPKYPQISHHEETPITVTNSTISK